MKRQDDILSRELIKIPKREWAKIWCLLNSWQIPDGMTKPEWWDTERHSFRRSQYITPVMQYIKFMIPKSQIDNYWIKYFTSIGEHAKKKRQKIISKLLVEPI